MFQRWFTALTLAVTLGGCAASRPPPPTNLPPPVTSTTLGVGDTFGVHIVGEKDLPEEYRIAPDGTVDYPYIGRVKVSGLEPQQVVDLLRTKLVDGQYLVNPQVSVIVKSYTSKKVTVIGQVTKPGSVPWTDGLKMVDAISQSGWFTVAADSNHVVLTRDVPPNKTVTAIVSIDAITDGQQADIPLQAGDTIKVEARVF